MNARAEVMDFCADAVEADPAEDGPVGGVGAGRLGAVDWQGGGRALDDGTRRWGWPAGFQHGTPSSSTAAMRQANAHSGLRHAAGIIFHDAV